MPTSGQAARHVGISDLKALHKTTDVASGVFPSFSQVKALSAFAPSNSANAPVLHDEVIVQAVA